MNAPYEPGAHDVTSSPDHHDHDDKMGPKLRNSDTGGIARHVRQSLALDLRTPPDPANRTENRSSLNVRTA